MKLNIKRTTELLRLAFVEGERFIALFRSLSSRKYCNSNHKTGGFEKRTTMRVR
jgi:hypothetical protein